MRDAAESESVPGGPARARRPAAAARPVGHARPSRRGASSAAPPPPPSSSAAATAAAASSSRRRRAGARRRVRSWVHEHERPAAAAAGSRARRARVEETPRSTAVHVRLLPPLDEVPKPHLRDARDDGADARRAPPPPLRADVVLERRLVVPASRGGGRTRPRGLRMLCPTRSPRGIRLGARLKARGWPRPRRVPRVRRRHQRQPAGSSMPATRRGNSVAALHLNRLFICRLIHVRLVRLAAALSSASSAPSPRA